MGIVTFGRLITGLLACAVLVLIVYRRGGRAESQRTGKGIAAPRATSR